jgi:hypothetical protein
LSAGQRNNTAVSTRPRKAPTLQAFGEQTKAAVAPVQALDEVATFAPEHEDVARERVCVAAHIRSYVADCDMQRTLQMPPESPVSEPFAAT